MGFPVLMNRVFITIYRPQLEGNTVNRLARKELTSDPVVLELSNQEKEAYDQIMQEKHENFSGQTYSFLEVKLRRLRRKT